MRKRLVLFDFDGVIVDTFSLCSGIASDFDPRVTPDVYRSYFEGNIFDSRVQREKSGQKVKPHDEWFQIYSPAMLKLPPVLGIADALRALNKEHLLIVVSSSVSSPIREYLKLHAFEDYFLEILGSDVDRSKEKKINDVLARHIVESDDAVFVTDTLGDMREASKCGVASIGVTWGFHPSETLLKGNPYAVADAPDDLPGLVHDFFMHGAVHRG